MARHQLATHLVAVGKRRGCMVEEQLGGLQKAGADSAMPLGLRHHVGQLASAIGKGFSVNVQAIQDCHE